MDDLRSEIRAAFQKEQTSHPSSPDLRHNIVQSVAGRPRRRVDLHWMAVAAAIVIAALVVVSLMSTRTAQRSVPSHPRPSPNGAGSDYGTPPAGVPLFYLRDPYNPGWYTGFDWTGQPRGTIKLAAPLDQSLGLLQSPDGSAFERTAGGKGGSVGQFYDRLGQPTSTDSMTNGVGMMWADDSRHLCALTLDRVSGSYSMWMLQPGHGGPTPVAELARDNVVGQSGIELVACSFKNDRAIAVRTTINYPSEIWVVRLSDGHVVSHDAVSGGQELANIAGSADGTLIAENSKGSLYGMSKSTQPTVIRRVSGQSVVRTLDPTNSVIEFSSDDGWALITTAPAYTIGNVSSTTQLALMNLATGTIVWRYETNKVFLRALGQPGGDAFAVVLSGNGGVPDWPVTAFIVYPDGKTVDLPTGYVTP